MTSSLQRKIILYLSVLLAAMVFTVSGIGLLDGQLYSRETLNWQAQSIGQDMVNVFLIAPFLLATSILLYKKSRVAMLLWSGAVYYLIYTFVIYSFAIHFNKLFILYCLILGLSFYLFLYFLFSQYKQPVSKWFTEKVPFRFIGIYLISISAIFYVLWLSGIITAIKNNTVPQDLQTIGLLTNPVHALDISVCLPAFLMTGILLLKKLPLGLLLAPAMLTFCVLMDISIAVLVVVMKMKGLEANLAVAIVMGILAILSIALLWWYVKAIKPLPVTSVFKPSNPSFSN